MPAFGFGVSDFVAVGQLAWKLFEACETTSLPTDPIVQVSDASAGRAAPGVFATISRELESLHCVLEEAADTQLAQPLPPRRQVRLKVILDNCISVLGDLQYIVQKYHSLGTDDRKAWDKLRLSNEDIAEIRSRLVFNITCLTAFRRFTLVFRPHHGYGVLTSGPIAISLIPGHSSDTRRRAHKDHGNGSSSSPVLTKSTRPGTRSRLRSPMEAYSVLGATLQPSSMTEDRS